MNATLHLTFRQWADAVDRNELTALRAIEAVLTMQLAALAPAIEAAYSTMCILGRADMFYDFASGQWDLV